MWLLPVASGALGAEDAGAAVDAPLRARAVAVLHAALTDRGGAARVAAAESLLWHGYHTREVKEVFLDLERAGDPAALPSGRIGVWRVLARAAAGKERDAYIARIAAAVEDPRSTERLAATVACAELDLQKLPGELPAVVEELARSAQGPLRAAARWVLSSCGGADGEESLAELLAAGDPETRAMAARGLRSLPAVEAATLARLRAASGREGAAGSEERVYLLGAIYVHSPESEKPAAREALLQLASGDEAVTKIQRREICTALGAAGDAGDIGFLRRLLEDGDTGVRVAAAHAILRIGRRRAHGLSILDWAVIALYALAVLAVGWYYSRRTATTEDYLLGGRSMKPWAVGLSLFATLLSTISYLAYPGEMIRYGPVFIGGILAYPFVVLVLGWFIIPSIARMRVTSAYEILEARLGLSVRLLGSVFFLSLRLLWMAVIIYATTDTVLIPLLGWSDAATPYACAVLGAITVAYTAMGGLRAVVFTDVLQTFILFGGAILALVLISVSLGGVSAWWPASWPQHWPEPIYGYDPTARMSLVGIALATFTWHVCTSASDQMAIQRYLATRDARAARRALTISMVAGGAVMVFLGLLGLALLAFFRARPHLIPDGPSVFQEADKLFPQYISFGLPVGLSGLVIAGLLAAAMSSLSSGVNSSCSVITVDFVDRFRRSERGATDHVRMAKMVSVLVGVAVVLLTSFVSLVPGNLLVLAYKVVNLLVAPLAGLFFLALFVRWATPFGTFAGAIVGLLLVVSINYWELIWQPLTGRPGISFLWAMPLGLVAEVGVGMLFSLLPVGKKRGVAGLTTPSSPHPPSGSGR
jgi:SSS family solute:Na+ symporter